MTHPIRPVKTFVLRLWREPGDQETEAAWRGLLRPLGTNAAAANKHEVLFHGLDNLLAALHPLLTLEEMEGAMDTPQRAPADDVAG